MYPSLARSLVRTLFRARGRRATYTTRTDSRTFSVDAIPVGNDREISESYGVDLDGKRQEWLVDALEIRDTSGVPIEPVEGDTLTLTESIDEAGRHERTRTWRIARPDGSVPAVEANSADRTVWRIHTKLISET